MIDVWVWTCIAALLLLIRVAPGLAPDIYNDSFQYLSVAGNTLEASRAKRPSSISTSSARSGPFPHLRSPPPHVGSHL